MFAVFCCSVSLVHQFSLLFWMFRIKKSLLPPVLGMRWQELLSRDSLQPHGLHSPWNSLGQNPGVGSLSLLQGIFPTQGLNPGLLHCRQTLYQLSHTGSPRILEWVAYPFFSRSPRPRNQTGVSCIAGGFCTSWGIWEAHSDMNASRSPSHLSLVPGPQFPLLPKREEHRCSEGEGVHDALYIFYQSVDQRNYRIGQPCPWEIAHSSKKKLWVPVVF